jgi:hypothetical protein
MRLAVFVFAVLAFGGCTAPALVYAPAPPVMAVPEQAGDVYLAGRWGPAGTQEEHSWTVSEDEALTLEPRGNWDGQVVLSPLQHVVVFAAASRSDTYVHRHEAADVGAGVYAPFAGGRAQVAGLVGWGRSDFTGVERESKRNGTLATAPFEIAGSFERVFAQVNIEADQGGGLSMGAAVRLGRVAYDATYTGLREPDAVPTDLTLAYIEPSLLLRYDAGLPLGAEVAFGWAERMSGPPAVEFGERPVTVTFGLGLELEELWR